MKQLSRMASPIDIMQANRKAILQFTLCLIYVSLLSFVAHAQEGEANPGKVKVIVLGARDKYHSPMVGKAGAMFNAIAETNNFDIHFTTDTSEINTLNLARYQVFVQLHLAPFDLSPSQQFAIQQFIQQGKGWVGIHAAGLIGSRFEKQNSYYWQWYDELLGRASYTPHPPLQKGSVIVEDKTHPVMQGLPPQFSLIDEWYEFEQPPVGAVVLAVADEKTYKPNKPMGYHPAVWINPEFDRVIYISVGHDSTSCSNSTYRTLVGNAVRWAADQKGKEQSKMGAFLSSEVSVLCNQVGYNIDFPKKAMLKSKSPLEENTSFEVVDALTLKPVYEGKIGKSVQVKDWGEHWYSPIDFTMLNKRGFYKIQISLSGKKYQSFDFELGNALLTKSLVPAITGFFEGQKALSKEELQGDEHVKLYGSEKTVDLRGGWCDASGDVSKYFSHLAYTNFMNPQQTPLVDWSMIETVESVPDILDNVKIKKALIEEAFYGADYIMKSLSPEGYFYMTLFSYFKKDPSERRVVGLLADSKTTSDYQSGYREGGGMGVAALARISQWKYPSKYKPEEYLKAAERAFAHLQKYSIKYIDDHKENILDDYTALMASTELWIATGKPEYQKEARKRADKLVSRQSPDGFFWSDDEKKRPFWHASDAGLPLLSLIRYLEIETDPSRKTKSLGAIKRYIDYQLKVSHDEANPFQYPRQTFRVNGMVRNGFFIPHDNESGWWWQGENARVGSLATVLLKGARLVYPENNAMGVKPEVAEYVTGLMNWILGNNPYQVCMMYGYGQINVPYMASMYGHGSGIGGISNGITGNKSNSDGTGIDFRYEDNGNEWRWSEQWIPHTAWFLQALATLESKSK